VSRPVSEFSGLGVPAIRQEQPFLESCFLLRRRRAADGHEAQFHRFQGQEEGYRAHLLVGHDASNPLSVYQGEEMLHQGKQCAGHVVIPWPTVHVQTVPGIVVKEELGSRP
jgi:hypothetical protein